MRIPDPRMVAKFMGMQVELQPGTALADCTSLGIGGVTDMLRIKKHECLPDLLNLLDVNHIPHQFLGGGSNLLVGDGELPWVVLQLVRPEPDVVLDGNFAQVDAAADLGRMITFCAKNNLGGMEGLIGVPGTVGGALRMNAGAYGMQIGSYVREVKLYRAAGRKIETLRGDQVSFEYRHTSFAPDDMMLAVILELPSIPFKEILHGIRICNEKRRSSQPLGQKSAGCIFKNPPGASAGRMKPVEIRRKKFSGRGWPFYRRVLVLALASVAGLAAAVYGTRFLLYSPSMLLLRPDQIELNGNRVVSRDAVLQQFVHDRNRSILRGPLEARRSQLEQVPWVESASVQR